MHCSKEGNRGELMEICVSLCIDIYRGYVRIRVPADGLHHRSPSTRAIKDGKKLHLIQYRESISHSLGSTSGTTNATSHLS